MFLQEVLSFVLPFFLSPCLSLILREIGVSCSLPSPPFLSSFLRCDASETCASHTVETSSDGTSETSAVDASDTRARDTGETSGKSSCETSANDASQASGVTSETTACGVSERCLKCYAFVSTTWIVATPRGAEPAGVSFEPVVRMCGGVWGAEALDALPSATRPVGACCCARWT